MDRGVDRLLRTRFQHFVHTEVETCQERLPNPARPVGVLWFSRPPRHFSRMMESAATIDSSIPYRSSSCYEMRAELREISLSQGQFQGQSIRSPHGLAHPQTTTHLRASAHVARRGPLEQAGAVVEEKLSATARLERVQQVIDGELAWAVGQARQPGADRGAWPM